MITFKNKGKSSAEITIYEDIGASWFGGMSAKDFVQKLRDLGNVDTIDVRISSYGGDVFDGLAIYRNLVEHKAKVITHIDGVAASIASVIAMAGKEIHIGASAQIMIHDAWAFAMGNAADMRDMANLLDTTSGAIADVYTARTNRDRDEVRGLMKAETWMIGQEAVDAKFATSVAENLKVAAKYDPTKHKFKNAPQRLIAPADHGAAHARFNEQRAISARRSLEARLK